MADGDVKDHLHHYLQQARDALVWKLEGLGEYDIRRPLTPTGTNLLGLVKHAGFVELEYFGPVFGRPHGITVPGWSDDGEDNVDMWATPEETRDEVAERYRLAWEVADATIAALPLDAPGRVPWWDDEGDVTLGRVLVHVTAELCRHAGHADIVRELIDGAAGVRLGNTNLPDGDAAWWTGYRDRVEQAARTAAGGRD